MRSRRRGNGRLFAWVGIWGFAAVAGIRAQAGETLTLERFLTQVRAGNQAVRSLIESSEGALERSGEGGLALSPALFATAQLGRDEWVQPGSFLSYDRINTGIYSLGVSKLTEFGLQAKLSYNVNRVSIINPASLMGGAGFSIPPFYQTKPTFELVQPLWANGFGRATRAQVLLTESQAKAASFASRYQARAALVEAEAAYWRLSVARAATRVQREALGRAEQIHEWSVRRLRMHLADRADELQARAALELKRLDVQASIDSERQAARDFNSARGIESDEVLEPLASAEIPPPPSQSPERAAFRDDVKAAERQRDAVQAGARLARERNLPMLDVYGSYAFNGRSESLGTSLGEPLRQGKETAAVGVRLSVPLDLGTLVANRTGWAREESAAGVGYERKLFEQERDWQELGKRLTDARRRLELAWTLEEVQKAKMIRERERLENGRSTTYQVLLFQQDYSQSQLVRLRSEAEVLGLLAQIKLFGDTPL